MASRISRGLALFGAIKSSSAVTAVTGVFSGAVTAASVICSGAVRARTNLSAKRSALVVADGASMVASAAGIMTNTIVTTDLTAARTITTDTATAIVALAVGYAVGDTTEVTFINITAATHVLTVAGGTGVTIVGVPTVAATQSATFLVRIASATTVVLYRK